MEVVINHDFYHLFEIFRIDIGTEVTARVHLAYCDSYDVACQIASALAVTDKEHQIYYVNICAGQHQHSNWYESFQLVESGEVLRRFKNQGEGLDD